LSIPKGESPAETATEPKRAPSRRPTIVGAIVIVLFTYGCAIQANSHANMNDHLGAEYFNIAKSIYAGEGFSSPFGEKTGPTSWMAPVLPAFLAGMLWVAGGDRGVVRIIVTWTQVHVLIATALLVLMLVRKSAERVAFATAVAVLAFVCLLFVTFRLSFMQTHDCWLVLLTLDAMVVWVCWFRPLGSLPSAFGWGAFGGFSALVGPIVGFTWVGMTLTLAISTGRWRTMLLAALICGLALAP
jgi:hypothetical protein